MSPIDGTSLKLMEVAVLKTPEWKKATAREGHVVQMFFNVNMGKAHKGLLILANEYGIALGDLAPGQYVGFLNRARTKVKLFTAGNLFAYLSLPPNAEVTLETLAQIPKMFLSQATLSYSNVIAEALESPIPLTGGDLDRQEREELMPGHHRSRKS